MAAEQQELSYRLQAGKWACWAVVKSDADLIFYISQNHKGMSRVGEADNTHHRSVGMDKGNFLVSLWMW